ncbi:MAG: DNA-binding GntR family transcriptional regulator [Granulosicoccus sp.]|jgi:DNA-binding GntR family transcriptional regulator
MQKFEGATKIAESSQQATEDKIVEQIFEAVVDQRLQPGTKLSEAALCEAFNVGRMHVRRALLVLANREVVEIISNRGAYIASPTEKQSRDVFEARLAIEPSVVKLAVRRANSADLARVAEHLEKEHIAHDSSNRHDAIRLSGNFHIMLAEIANNDVMLSTIVDLVARASLIISIYGAPNVSSCRDDDHTELLEAFRTGQEELAASLMYSHLNKIQNSLNFEKRKSQTVDIVSLFSGC